MEKEKENHHSREKYNRRSSSRDKKKKRYYEEESASDDDSKKKLSDKINKNVSLEKKIAQSVKSIEDRVNRRKNKTNKNFLLSFIEQEDGTIDYYKWIAVFIVMLICIVVFIILSQMDIEECTCDS